MLSLLKHLGRRAAFQPDNNPKHSDKKKLLKKQMVKLVGWPYMLLDLKPIKNLWFVLLLFACYASLGISPLYYLLNLRKKKIIFAQNIYTINTISIYKSNSIK